MNISPSYSSLSLFIPNSSFPPHSHFPVPQSLVISQFLVLKSYCIYPFRVSFHSLFQTIIPHSQLPTFHSIPSSSFPAPHFLFNCLFPVTHSQLPNLHLNFPSQYLKSPLDSKFPSVQFPSSFGFLLLIPLPSVLLHPR